MPKLKTINKVMVIGSGPIVIGQAAEFDYAGTQACLALKEEGIEVVLVNNNPATIMTDDRVADRVYMEPLEVDTLEKIIAKEQPDGLIGSLGGQTGLNLTVELFDKGILDKYNVVLLGTSVASIKRGEDRELFRQLMIDIEEPIADSKIVQSVEEGLQFTEEIGFPVILRPAYTLGGEGGGFAYNKEEFVNQLNNGLTLSPIHQVLVERSIKGWKEIEFEVMRDLHDTCVIVCDMENVDPVGVHTGDSIVVAPSQTLTDTQYQMLRYASQKIIRALDVVGGCNIQFALHPETDEYIIIEVNPRVSRSSALASKATGYPIARIAAKCAIGYKLDEILNPITGSTYASTEPVLDYIVVKIPRFPFDKFTEADRSLGTQMKATGEVMAIERTFAGALHKAIRSLELNVFSLDFPGMGKKSKLELLELLENPNDLRVFAIAEALRRSYQIETVIELTKIDYWFIQQMKEIIDCEQEIAAYQLHTVPIKLIKRGKQLNISDIRIAELLGTTAKELRGMYKENEMLPSFMLVDTGTADTEAITPYFYSTWNGSDEVVTQANKKKILVLGSGPIRIGQGVEFDYCSVHAALALKKIGYEAVVMNNNPETVSTDYSVADRLYFEPLALEDVLAVVEKEQVAGVLIQFGGQTAINLANELKEEGVHIFGTLPEHIDQMEDREQFYNFLSGLNIPHIEGRIVHGLDEFPSLVYELGFPVLIRPSYVIGGQSMFICYNEEELYQYIARIQRDTNDRCWPLLIDQYLPGLECEVDVVSDGNEIAVPGIVEHIEKAGIHSGDSMGIFPPATLSDDTKAAIVKIAQKISRNLPVVGMMNIQFVIHENTIYVLEVNPRSSRTVPIMSKVTGIPMVEWAVRAQLGTFLSEITNEINLMKEPAYYTIKAPVFSASKLKGVDHVLGPEMKSTGEIIGLGYNKKEALKKTTTRTHHLNAAAKPIHLFVSISDRLKQESLPIIRELSDRGAIITATEGTAKFIEKNGMAAEKVVKSKKDILNQWQEYPPHIVLNIPNQGREKEKTGFFIRELSVRFQTPYFTSLETLQVLVDGFNQTLHVEEILSLQEYLNRSLKADKIIVK